ncbi:piggyBac transposable element-derived protein 2-like [Dermacentor andersoni]|uniref:piggyBac transposable element-derived protein 2-like n=1 Tax=Dermacentor andersoni TaxID=34620 RepID=UPI003B3A52DC
MAPRGPHNSILSIENMDSTCSRPRREPSYSLSSSDLCWCIDFEERFFICRQRLTDKEIQAILFEYPSGSEDENLEGSDCDEEYTPQERTVQSVSESSSDSEEEVQVTSTKKKKQTKIWHWVKKDININRGEEESVLKPTDGLERVKSPLSMFLNLVDSDLIEFLTFETNRFRTQENRTRILPVSVLEMRTFIGIVLYISVVDLPFRRRYWSANTRQADIADCMTRNRFDEIMSLFHAGNNDEAREKGEEGYDCLHKVRHVLTSLNNTLADIL